jgi:hypothetical protein
MTLIEIDRQQKRIDDLFDLAKGLSPEVQSHWSRYICVVIAGFLEISVQGVYLEYIRGKAHPNIIRHMERRMREFQNANMKKINDMARSFNEDWAVALEHETTIKDSVDSILNNRHHIAHGRSSDITIGRLKPWYKDAVRLVDMMKTQCGI